VNRMPPPSSSPRVGFGRRPAVLAVDFACGWTDPAAPMAVPLEAAIDATACVIRAARPAGAPVIFTTYEVGPPGAASPLLRKSPRVACMTPGSPWTRIDPRLPRLPDDYVLVKPAGSAFFATSLAAMLRTLHVDTVLVCGCVTSGCVRATAVDAAQHGLHTIVVREAVGDRSAAAHEANLLDIDQRYGDVVLMDEVIAWLDDVALRHPDAPEPR